MEEVIKLNDLLVKYHENKNSHVYLVVTNSISDAVNDIKLLIKKINNDENINLLIDSDNLLSLTIIEPKNQEIVTDDIEKLIINLQKLPVITKENYFIISSAERLNIKSGNQLLKSIEEPETDMIGFLICNNIDNVMPTIVSRSQIIYLNYETDVMYDEDLINDATSFFEMIHKNCSILYNKYYADKYKSNEELNKFINCLVSQEKNIFVH